MIAPHDPEGNQNERFLFFAQEIRDTLSYIQYCNSEDNLKQKGLLMSLLAYDDLIYKLSRLSRLADEIKEEPVFEHFELYYYCHATAIDSFCARSDLPPFTPSPLRPRIDGYFWAQGFELSDCPADQKTSLESVAAIEKETCLDLERHRTSLEAFVREVEEKYTSILAGMDNYLLFTFYDASQRNNLVNEWYKRHYEEEFKKISIGIQLTYKNRENEIQMLDKKEKETLERNTLYEQYKGALDPATMKCDYGSFFADLNDRFKGRFIDADCLASLHDLFVSITKIEAYDALLDGQPLPGYKPLIPDDEEEEEVAVPSTAIEEKSEQEKVDKPKSKQRKVKKFEDYFYEADTRKKNDILIQLEKVVPTLCAKQLAAVLEYTYRCGLLYAKPNYAEIERQFGNLNCSRQGLDNFKKFKFTDEELEFCKAFFKIKE